MGESLQRLSVRLRDHPDPRDLTAVLRETLDDPTLELVYWDPTPGRWVDASAQPVSLPAADSERRRIERDLHDGAQQRLVALRIRLGLAGDLMREDPACGEELLSELGTEAEEALEEVRSLAHGVYPSLLADQGLGEALRALSRSSAQS